MSHRIKINIGDEVLLPGLAQQGRQDEEPALWDGRAKQRAQLRETRRFSHDDAQQRQIVRYESVVLILELVTCQMFLPGIIKVGKPQEPFLDVGYWG